MGCIQHQLIKGIGGHTVVCLNCAQTFLLNYDIDPYTDLRVRKSNSSKPLSPRRYKLLNTVGELVTGWGGFCACEHTQVRCDARSIPTSPEDFSWRCSRITGHKGNHVACVPGYHTFRIWRQKKPKPTKVPLTKVIRDFAKYTKELFHGKN